MPIDPSIISNAFANISTPDVNALMQQRIQGAQNIYQIEAGRQEQAAQAEKEAAKQAAEAMLPAVASAFSDPSDAGLDAAASMLPPEVSQAFTPFLQRLKGVPDAKQRMAILRAELARDDDGRYILGQLEPTANMRLQEGTAARRAALDERRLALDEAKLGGRPEASYKEIVLDDGTLVLMDTKSGSIIQPSMEAPINTALPPDETAGKPLKARQKDGAGASESERLAGYNAGRALDAAKRISSALEKDPAASAPGLIETAVGRVADPNILRGEGRQRVAAAQRELIDALLTLATGAAYNREQLEGQMESYIPKWSDKPGSREDKRAALLGLIQNAKVKAGRAWTPAMDEAFQQLLTPPSAGAEPSPAATPTALPEGATTTNW